MLSYESSCGALICVLWTNPAQVSLNRTPRTNGPTPGASPDSEFASSSDLFVRIPCGPTIPMAAGCNHIFYRSYSNDSPLLLRSKFTRVLFHPGQELSRLFFPGRDHFHAARCPCPSRGRRYTHGPSRAGCRWRCSYRWQGRPRDPRSAPGGHRGAHAQQSGRVCGGL